MFFFFNSKMARLTLNIMTMMQDQCHGSGVSVIGIRYTSDRRGNLWLLNAMRSHFRTWFFPNGTRVSSRGNKWIYRDIGQMVVGLNRRRVGVEGIYCCEIPDSTNVTQTMYIGVYRASASTGEYTVYFYSTVVILFCCSVLCCRRYSIIEYAAYEMPCISELTYVHPKMWNKVNAQIRGNIRYSTWALMC